MTKRKNMTAGQRQVKLETQITEMEEQIKQLTFATRIFQQLMQQSGSNLNNLSQDLGELSGRQRDLQYRFLAYQNLSNLTSDQINAESEKLQIADFEEFSAKDDIENGYAVVETVEEDSIVIFTTEADNGKGYLRSKQSLSDLAFPQMKEDLVGKKAGDVVDVDVNGVQHKLTILGVRKAPEQEKAENEQENGQEVPESAE